MNIQGEVSLLEVFFNAKFYPRETAIERHKRNISWSQTDAHCIL